MCKFSGKLGYSKDNRWKIMRDKKGLFLRLQLWSGRIELRHAPPDELGPRKDATIFMEHGGHWIPESGPVFGAETARHDSHQFYVQQQVRRARNALTEFGAQNA